MIRKSFHLPNVGTIVCVDSFVIAQVRLLGKSLLAIAANVLLVRRVIPDVVQQRRLPVENLLAQWALALLPQEDFPIHVDERLLKFKRR